MKISAHVLDGTYGQPAAGVRARLARSADGMWIPVADMETDEGGLIEDWGSWRLERGLYQIVFDSDSYFAGLGTLAAYTGVALIFRMVAEAHVFQAQVVLAPYAYSTYFNECR